MLILLDRDGVINVDYPQGVHTVESFHLIPRSAEAVRTLNNAGFKVAVVTNQALVGRGEISQIQLDHIHDYMISLFQKVGATLDHIFYCTDTTIEPNYRRKPAPGMLIEAMNFFQIQPTETVMIGDDLRDLQAATAAGCQRILVRTGKGLKAQQQSLDTYKPFVIFDDLWDAAQALVSRS